MKTQKLKILAKEKEKHLWMSKTLILALEHMMMV
jgi:hypothetical protein